MFKFFIISLSLSCVFANTYEYQKCYINPTDIQYFPQSCTPGAYLYPSITQYIVTSQIQVIFEVGSRDCLDALRLSEYYKCHVWSFECNPLCLEVCKHNSSLSKNVTLVEKAVWDEEGIIEFFPVVSANGKIPDPGSSSCYIMTQETSQEYQQAKISVPAQRLDTFMHENNIQSVDMLCIDAQGATLNILKSLGPHIKNIKYIITECEITERYTGEILLPELIKYLNEQGFDFIPDVAKWDYLFINRKNNKFQ